ncbi:MAG: recombination mediator RecR [Syntrophales bacterium]|nr:recombination mediator RecR [Syntrophales bacterium]
MSGYAPPIQRLIKELARFPGIGEKTAARLANFILHEPAEDARRLAESIIEVKEKIRLCSVCFNLSENDICAICADHGRDHHTICIVEDPDALIAIEETGSFKGTYHVLHGTLAPLDGIGPDDLRIQELLNRIRISPVQEIIIATNPNVQGESTAILITRVLQEKNVRISRIAMGVPVGGDLKYTDRMTLGKALEFRRNM